MEMESRTQKGATFTHTHTHKVGRAYPSQHFFRHAHTENPVIDADDDQSIDILREMNESYTIFETRASSQGSLAAVPILVTGPK